jgi:hypothetical protein
MLSRKRVIASLAGLLALSALAGGDAAALVLPRDDNYSNHAIGDKGTKPRYEANFVGRRLVIYLRGPEGIFRNDTNKGPGRELLLGLSRTPMSGGIARFAIKYGKGPNHQARIVIHLRKDFAGEARLRYSVASGRDRDRITYSRIHIHADCGKVSCS